MLSKRLVCREQPTSYVALKTANLETESGQIIEITTSRLMYYHSHLKAVADSVPCSATSTIKACRDAGLFYFLQFLRDFYNSLFEREWEEMVNCGKCVATSHKTTYTFYRYGQQPTSFQAICAKGATTHPGSGARFIAGDSHRPCPAADATAQGQFAAGAELPSQGTD